MSVTAVETPMKSATTIRTIQSLVRPPYWKAELWKLSHQRRRERQVLLDYEKELKQRSFVKAKLYAPALTGRSQFVQRLKTLVGHVEEDRQGEREIDSEELETNHE